MVTSGVSAYQDTVRREFSAPKRDEPGRRPE